MAKVGRPKLDNPRNKTISETRVTKEEYRMIALKSALYAGGSTAKFVRMATESFNGDIPEKMTCSCGKTSRLHGGSEVYKIKTGNVENEVIVVNIPEYRCSCGEILADLTLSAAIETQVHQILEECLKDDIPIPDQINFQDMLTSKFLI